MSSTYRFKTRPYKHQKTAIRKLLKNGFGGALLMEPRTGKTKTVIDYLSIQVQLRRIDRAVIVCPARVMDVWVEEFFNHCPVHYDITIWDKHARKEKLLPPRGPHRLHILLVNYDAFGIPGRRLASGRRSKASGRYSFRNQLVKWVDAKPAACVLDESHKVKSPSGKTSTMVVSLGKYFDYRIIMTGTPVTKAKRVFDIWMQWEFLNPERFADFGSATQFKNYFGQWTNRNGYPQFLKNRNTAELQELIHMDAFVITRDECYDLPPKTHRVITVPLSARTGKIYDDLAQEMIAEIEHEDLTHMTEASIPLVLTLRLSQITGGFAKTTEKDTIQVGTEKLDVLSDLMDEAMENDEKTIIVARFKSDLDAAIATCAKKGIPTFAIRGKLTRQQMTKNIRDFKEIEGVAACVMQPKAGGVGIDLSTAPHMIWYSLTPSWVDFTQACDRNALSPTPTTYTYLLAENTVDQLLYDTLQDDGDIARAILADPRKVLRR